MQQIIETDSYADALREVLSIDESLYVVCSKRERERLLLDLKGYSITFFHGYSPNPKYEEIMEGVELFKQGEYETIVALGGGSALDVAKCIKLFQEASKEDFLNIAEGGGQPNISQDKIKNQWMLIPSLEEQQNIVKYLKLATTQFPA